MYLRIFVVMWIFYYPLYANYSRELSSVKFGLPFGITSFKNSAKKPSLEIVGGIAAEKWIYKIDNFRLSLGVGLYALGNFLNGTDSVSFSSKTFFEETRLSFAYGVFGSFSTLLPYIGIATQIGALFSHKKVLKDVSRSTNFFGAFSAYAGLQYIFDRFGLGLEYGGNFSNKNSKHYLCLAFLWLWPNLF